MATRWDCMVHERRLPIRIESMHDIYAMNHDLTNCTCRDCLVARKDRYYENRTIQAINRDAKAKLEEELNRRKSKRLDPPVDKHLDQKNNWWRDYDRLGDVPPTVKGVWRKVRHECLVPLDPWSLQSGDTWFCRECEIRWSLTTVSYDKAFDYEEGARANLHGISPFPATRYKYLGNYLSWWTNGFKYRWEEIKVVPNYLDLRISLQSLGLA